MNILLVMTSHFGFHEMFEKNLQKLGHTVTYVDADAFRYRNFYERGQNFIQKNIFGNKDFKHKLRKKHMEESLFRKLDYPEKHFDICLVVRPDLYSTEVAKRLKAVSRKLIAYQWDGFSRFRIDEGMIEQFDRFAVFDRTDYSENCSKHPNLFHAQNFYFDFPEQNTPKDLDLIYVGTFDEDRLQILKYLDSVLENGVLKYSLKLFINNFSKPVDRKEGNIQIDNKIMPYQEMLSKSSRAKAVLDLKYPEHSGLSFRFYEALFFSQKIITNNPEAYNSDFYSAANILIFEDKKELTEDLVSSFINAPYERLKPTTSEKYSFSHWWQTLTDLPAKD